jgi:hypothetical protein
VFDFDHLRSVSGRRIYGLAQTTGLREGMMDQVERLDGIVARTSSQWLALP